MPFLGSGEHFAYFIKFEKLYKLIKHDMPLPEAVKEYFLLSGANMSEENEKFVRIACGVLGYKQMENTTMDIFDNTCGSERNSNVDPLRYFRCQYR